MAFTQLENLFICQSLILMVEKQLFQDPWDKVWDEVAMHRHTHLIWTTNGIYKLTSDKVCVMKSCQRVFAMVKDIFW